MIGSHQDFSSLVRCRKYGWLDTEDAPLVEAVPTHGAGIYPPLCGSVGCLYVCFALST